MAAGASFCSNCGQAFSVVAAAPPMRMLSASAAPMAGGAAIPAYAVPAAVPRAEYAGFWLRLVAFVIDNVLLGLGFFLVVIPLLFLTGFRTFFDEFDPGESLNDAGIFMLIVFFFLAATGALALTWLYHALMECSEWQATLGKKALGLVVTDMAGQRVSFGRATEGTSARYLRTWSQPLSGTLWPASPIRSRRCTICWRAAWCSAERVEAQENKPTKIGRPGFCGQIS
jgi:hypothetical protein